MAARTSPKAAPVAVATGAAATGAASLAAAAVGALAIGALAVGALAIGRLSVGRARLRRVEIGELAVGRLEVGTAGGWSAVGRIRAAPGKGDGLERLLREALARAAPGTLQAYRSDADPDLFLLCEGGAPVHPADGVASLMREAVSRTLAAEGDEAAVYRAIAPAAAPATPRRASPARR